MRGRRPPGDAADAYLATSTRPGGPHAWRRAVRAGELLPRAALEEAPELVQLALPVQSGYVPPGLTRGQLVDVYAVADPAAGATGVADGSVTLVVRGRHGAGGLRSLRRGALDADERRSRSSSRWRPATPPDVLGAIGAARSWWSSMSRWTPGPGAPVRRPARPRAGPTG